MYDHGSLETQVINIIHASQTDQKVSIGRKVSKEVSYPKRTELVRILTTEV